MSSLNRKAARSRASCAAFLVKARKAICWGFVPAFSASSTMFKRVVVLPVPGGPNILNILELRRSPHPVCASNRLSVHEFILPVRDHPTGNVVNNSTPGKVLFHMLGYLLTLGLFGQKGASSPLEPRGVVT